MLGPIVFPANVGFPALYYHLGVGFFSCFHLYNSYIICLAMLRTLGSQVLGAQITQVLDCIILIGE